jgi:hypothetical protein
MVCSLRLLSCLFASGSLALIFRQGVGRVCWLFRLSEAAMQVLFLLLLPLLSVHAEDLGELSANPAGLSGSFSFFGLFGSFGFFGFPIGQPIERDKPNKPSKSVLVLPNQTDQINQTNEINQFRLSLRPRPVN